MLLGMCYHRKDPNHAPKTYAYAAAAKLEGVDFLYFSPAGIDFEEEAINGFRYEEGRWHSVRSPFPDIVYNSGRIVSGKTEERLRQLGGLVPFMCHSVGNKWILYEMITANKKFDQYLLPSSIVTGTDVVLAFLEQYGKIIVKPVQANQGKGIVLIGSLAGEESGSFVWTEQGTTKRMTKAQLLEEIRSLVLTGRERRLVQPYIVRRNAAGEAFDFRVHVQKTGMGLWAVTSLYPRVAPLGTVPTNFGYTSYITGFMRGHLGEGYWNAMNRMRQFGIQLAEHLDEIYGVSFDELGIDIILDDNNRIWLLEANWRPGPPPIFDLELDAPRRTVQYAMYLYRQRTRHSNGYSKSSQSTVFLS